MRPLCPWFLWLSQLQTMWLQRCRHRERSLRFLHRTLPLQGRPQRCLYVLQAHTSGTILIFLYRVPHKHSLLYWYEKCRAMPNWPVGQPNPKSTCSASHLQENVEGTRCDQCRVGTFHLDPTNPKGCTKCFCFGATDRCRSSEKRRKEVTKSPQSYLLYTQSTVLCAHAHK